MKNILKQITLLLVFITTTLQAQTPATITKGAEYTGTINETLIATQSITLGTGVFIQAGSTFVAKINSDAYIGVVFSNENYVFTRSFQSPMTTTAGIVNNGDVFETINYFDGLGRPMQSISIKGSPGKQDVVTHIGYDDFGRQDKEYLPYLDTFGSIASYRLSTDAVLRTNAYYISNYSADINSALPNPFSEKEFEKSPLNRVLKQAAPGKDWALSAGHEIKLDYQTNVTGDNVKIYNVSTVLNGEGVYVPTVSTSANYLIGQLYKTVTKDENWTSGNNNTTEEFKDKEGRVILKRTYGVSMVNNVAVNTPHETYYIYDNYGNLTYVLPPKAEGAITESVLNDLCYRYRYDSRNRLIEKKLPGKDWEYIVYDKLDRPILTQDANLRVTNKWLFTKYDAFNRPVYTGEYANGTQKTRALVQSLANGSSSSFEKRETTARTIGTTSIHYSNAAFPIVDIDLFTINYYDDYLNIDLDGSTAAAAVSYGITPITNAKGLNTCSKVRVLTTSSWITNVNYYDGKARVICNYNKNNFLDIVDTVKSQLDFGGKVLETTATHKKGATATITIVDTYSYDHVGRLLTQKQRIDNQTQEVIAANSYDNLGQLKSKGVGGKITQNRLQTVDYTYNIRGWLKGINDTDTSNSAITMGSGDLFGFQINYNSTATGTALYNGNISQTFWKTINPDTSLKNYTYTYDALNRLTNAIDGSSVNANRYNESLSYDKNGNITNLTRLGHTDQNATAFGNMDILTYTYATGNKLDKVEDSSGSTEGFKNGSTAAIEYAYDDNGNMIKDLNKGIGTATVRGVYYNHLNLPTQIILTGGTIDYYYDATGVKQRKIVSTGATTEYSGSFIYENSVLKFFSQPEGYVAKNTGIFDYIYQYKDHLGNIRLSYGDKDNSGAVNNTEIIEENNYYPFGLKQKGYNKDYVIGKGNDIAQKYKYNGKELQEELGLNIYAFGWRDYDPAIGRFTKIDRFVEKYSELTPYNYTANNPLLYREIAGDSINVSRLIGFDKVTKGNTTQKIINDLIAITGLNVIVNQATGLIEYQKDANGNPIINQTNGAQEGSSTARNDLISIINGPEVIVSGGRRSVTAGNDISIGAPQIDSFINGTPLELDNRTLGYGMVFMHELRHTTAAGGAHDPPLGSTATGTVVDRVNVYRRELDNNSTTTGTGQFGQRSQYHVNPNATAPSIDFQYQAVNRRGKTVTRSTSITF